jgi:hypothetical protein
MRGELSRIFALVSLGFLIVLYVAIEVCIWLSRRSSKAAAGRPEASVAVELGRASDLDPYVGDVQRGGGNKRERVAV